MKKQFLVFLTAITFLLALANPYAESQEPPKSPIIIAVDGLALREVGPMGIEPLKFFMGKEPDGYLAGALKESSGIKAMNAEIKPYTWSRDPADTKSLETKVIESSTKTSTPVAVLHNPAGAIENLKINIKQEYDAAKKDNRPLVIVAHSWGSVLAYTALKELGKSVKVDSFITMGSPLAASSRADLAGLVTGSLILIETLKENLPLSMLPRSIEKPENVKGDWVNLWAKGDLFSNEIGGARNIQIDKGEEPSFLDRTVHPKKNTEKWHKEYYVNSQWIDTEVPRAIAAGIGKTLLFKDTTESIKEALTFPALLLKKIGAGLAWTKTALAPSDASHITDDNKLTFVASKESEVLPTSGIYAYRLLLKTKSPHDGVNYPTGDSGNTTLFVNWATGKVYGFSDGNFSPNTSANGILKGNVDRTNKRIYIDEWGMQTSYLGTTDDNTHARFIIAEDVIINLDRNEIKSGSFNVQWRAGDLHAYNTTGTYSGTSQSFNAAPSVTPDNGEVWKGFAAGVHYKPSNSTFDTLYNTSSNDVYVTFRTSDNNVDGSVLVANADSSITELFTFNDYHFVSKDAFGGECSDACGGRVKGFGTTGDSRDYNYISWGKWADEWGAPNEQRIFGVGSYWIVGRLTPYADIPTTGTATYSGKVMGSLINNGTGLFTGLDGTTSLTANFANKTVAGTFDNLKKSDGSIWVNQANVNANWGGANAISGTIAGGGKSGNINGAFFGPQVQEIGGNWTLNGGGDKAAGIFTGKK